MVYNEQGDIVVGGTGVIGPDIPDSRDYKYIDHLSGVSESTVSTASTYALPTSFNDCSLKSFIGDIKNQGSTNSCTGHSAYYAMNVLLNRINGDDIGQWNINPWWIYYWARKESNIENRDGGAYMRCLMNALRIYGVYSNNMSSPESKPGEYDLNDAFKIKKYFRISNNLNEVKYALSVERLPVFACWCVYNDAIDKYTGIISPSNEQMNGYHAICLTGLKTIKGKQYIEFANSWGKLWGDEGFGYLDPDVVRDERLITDIYCPTYDYN